MAQAIVMPKIGMTMTEGQITKWYKKEGDLIAVGDKVFDIETDKLTDTVESSKAGILRKILQPEGATLLCLEPAGIIGAADEDISGLIDEAASRSPEVSAGVAAVAAVSAGVGEPVAVDGVGGDAAGGAGGAGGAGSTGRIIAAPAAKKLAKEKGIDLALVTGTGPGGRIRLEDIEGFLASEEKPADAAVKSSPLAAKVAEDLGVDLSEVPTEGRVMSADVLEHAQQADQDAVATEERVPMSTIRKVIARRMRESVDISPTVTFDISVDMSALANARAELAVDGLKVSYNDLIVQAAAKALLAYPQLNCSIDGTDIIYHHYVNMGIAVALDDGLIVPVVKNAQSKSLAEISTEVKELAAKAREMKLRLDDMTGGTFTISNLGMLGIESFTPIINQPEVAILGVNAIKDSVVVVDGTMEIRPIMKLSLTADHRAIDGAVAAQFLALLKKYLEKPLLLLMA